jgi:Tfp pilus assembly protein PilN
MAHVNLVPQSVRIRRARLRRAQQWLVVCVVAFGGMVLPLIFDALQRARLAELRRGSDGLHGQLEVQRKELRALTAQAAHAQIQLEHAESLRAKRAWSGVIARIASSLPDGCWLTALATDPATPSASRSAPPPAPAGSTSTAPAELTLDAPRKLKMTGYARDAAHPHAFAGSLRETGLFSQVALRNSVREPVLDGFYFRFELECEW